MSSIQKKLMVSSVILEPLPLPERRISSWQTQLARDKWVKLLV